MNATGGDRSRGTRDPTGGLNGDDSCGGGSDGRAARPAPPEDPLAEIFAMFEGVDLSEAGGAVDEAPAEAKPTGGVFDTSDDPFAMFAMAADEDLKPEDPS